MIWLSLGSFIAAIGAVITGLVFWAGDSALGSVLFWVLSLLLTGLGIFSLFG